MGKFLLCSYERSRLFTAAAIILGNVEVTVLNSVTWKYASSGAS